MREYGVLRVSFWTDPELSVMSDAANRLAAYYITGSHTTLIGCFRCPVGYVCSDLHWTEAKVLATERELGAFVWRDGEWVFLPTYLRWNAIENPNQGKSAVRLFGQVPDRLKCYGAVAEALLTQAETLSEGFRNRLADIAEQFRNKDQDQEQKKEQEQTSAGGSGAAPAKRTGRPPSTGIVKAGTTPGALAFEAYAEAYRQRYGTDPVRNHKVNIAFADLAKRLPAEEAPEVAAYYVHHSAAFYVQSGHAPGLLLRDCEKLRTEWATGRQVNAHTARQNEQTAGNAAWQYAQELERKEREGR